MEVAPQGFLNLRLAPRFVSDSLLALLDDDTLGVRRDERPGTVVIDYSAPNVAKEMHVGHLRSTVIGDALARMAEGTGRTVVRQNHLGDWELAHPVEHVAAGQADAARLFCEALYGERAT